MSLPRPSHVPMRLSAGAIILSSGLDKRNADAETAQGLHGMAASAYPLVADMDPQTFVKQLSRVEIALGVALMLPMVPSWIVAPALTAFAGGLVGMYVKTPSLHREGSLRPNSGGIGVAKDVWLLGMALGMVLDLLTPRRRRAVKVRSA